MSHPSANKRAICILLRDFDLNWFSFLNNRFSHLLSSTYDIYMILDKNPSVKKETNIIPTMVKKIYNVSNPTEPNLFFPIYTIQIDENKCRESNYYKSSTWTNLKDVVAWDKALFFLNKLCEKKYDHVWFLEEDVLFYDENTILNVDAKYPNSDLLTPFHEINETGNIYQGWNHWVNVIHRIGTPWARSLVAASRLSGRLLERIDDYLHDRPFMIIESLFNTLALHHNYSIDTPLELSTITYDKKWDSIEINDPLQFYHPLKQTAQHELLRGGMINCLSRCEIKK